jgi:hypothetical protein
MLTRINRKSCRAFAFPELGKHLKTHGEIALAEKITITILRSIFLSMAVAGRTQSPLRPHFPHSLA